MSSGGLRGGKEDWDAGLDSEATMSGQVLSCGPGRSPSSGRGSLASHGWGWAAQA